MRRRIVDVTLHPQARLFRRLSPRRVRQALTGSILERSEARGKQLLFVFQRGVWLGLHLGMTGKLWAAPEGFVPGRHDHLVLRQNGRALVFTDPRQFGRVQMHLGPQAPDWWTALPSAITSPEFTSRRMRAFLDRHSRLPVKAALLLQSGFPGIGNWMADEVLWRARIHPARPAGELSQAALQALWTALRFVCRGALKHVGADYSDPPQGWLFHERWGKGGRCPTHGALLRRDTVGGRTTVWCGICQEPPQALKSQRAGAKGGRESDRSQAPGCGRSRGGRGAGE